MADIIVKYNGRALFPTPLVQQNIEFIDYNSRWGHTAKIELNGFLTGSGWHAAESGIAQYFTGQFGNLEVFDGAVSLYIWPNCIVEEISFPLNHWFVFSGGSGTSMVPYTARMRSINVPSGVVEPVNEYAFVQGEDGLVNVTHKVSARGIHTAVDGLSNAVAFVKTFKDVNPFSSFAPFFIPSGRGILASFSETIDRATSSYSIQEVYKYNTGYLSGFLESWTVNHSDVFDDEYATFDVDWKMNASPVTKDLASLEGGYLSYTTPLTKLAALGYSTGNMMQSSFSVSRDSGAASVNINASFVSGHTLSDINGYFDYTVSVDLDGTIPREDWKIDGEFICYGPAQFKKNRVAAFKAASGATNADWRFMLSGLITSSPLFLSYHDGSAAFSSQRDIKISEVTGLGILKLSLTTSDGMIPSTSDVWNQGTISSQRYTITVEPSMWQYNLLPSANIEGVYVLQDLQLQTHSKISILTEGESRQKRLGVIYLSGVVDSLADIYIGSGYMNAESYNTGTFDLSYQRSWLALESMSTGISFTKAAASLNPSLYVRCPGHLFGY